MKKLLTFILAAILLTVNASAIDLYVDFGRLNTDAPPANVGGRTLVPVRAIFEALGATVKWDTATRTATGTYNDITIVMQIDNQTAYVNGESKALDVPAQLINGRTMVPARFISEALGYDVTWYQPTQTAAVAYQLKGCNFYTSENTDLYHFDSGCNGKSYLAVSLAEVMGRGLLPCVDCVPTDIATIHDDASMSDYSSSDVITVNPSDTSVSSGSASIANSTNANSGSGGSSAGNGSNFNIYNNESQQNTTANYVLNTSTLKFHRPSCKSVKKIAPGNYDTSSNSRESLISQGYSPCKNCNP